MRARLEAGEAELARTRADEERSAIATAKARVEAESRAETAERIRTQADQCAATLAEERARTEALALEAERRKLEAARAALEAADRRALAEEEAATLASAHSRTDGEHAEVRARLRAFWVREVRSHHPLALRVAAAAVIVAAVGYFALRPAPNLPVAAPEAAPALRDAPALRLDYKLGTSLDR